MTDTPPEPPAVGPLAKEAALLLDVVADRLTSMKPGDDSGTADAGTADADGATGSAGASGTQDRCPECGAVPGGSCTACPLCRFMAVLRGERPEATARLVDGALMIVRTLRSLIGEPAEASTDGQHSRPSAGERQEPPASRRGGLEHIDIL